MKKVIVLAVMALTGCSTLQQGQELAKQTGVEDQAIKAIEAYAASKGLPINLSGSPAKADPFSTLPATYSEWVDANGEPIKFPITRTVKKEFTETVGATTVSTLQVPATVPVQPAPAGGGNSSGVTDAERAALQQLGVTIP